MTYFIEGKPKAEPYNDLYRLSMGEIELVLTPQAMSSLHGAIHRAEAKRQAQRRNAVEPIPLFAGCNGCERYPHLSKARKETA